MEVVSRTNTERITKINNRKVICGPVKRYFKIWFAFERYAKKVAKKTGFRPPIGDPIHHNGRWYMVKANQTH